jgi:hypothetical protein
VFAVGAKHAEVYREYRLLPQIVRLQNPAAAASANKVQPATDYNDKLHAALANAQIAPRRLRFYAMPSLFVAYTEREQFPLQAVPLRPIGSHLAAGQTNCLTPCALETTLFASPYFRVTLNDTPVPASSLRVLDDRIVILIEKSGHYRVVVKLGTWATQLYRWSISVLAMAFWLAGLGLAWQAATHRAFWRRWRGGVGAGSPTIAPASIEPPKPQA